MFLVLLKSIGAIIVSLGILVYLVITLFYLFKYKSQVLSFHVSLLRKWGINWSKDWDEFYKIISLYALPPIMIFCSFFFVNVLYDNMVMVFKVDASWEDIMRCTVSVKDLSFYLIVSFVMFMHGLAIICFPRKALNYIQNRLSKDLKLEGSHPIVKLFRDLYFCASIMFMLLGALSFIYFIC